MIKIVERMARAVREVHWMLHPLLESQRMRYLSLMVGYRDAYVCHRSRRDIFSPEDVTHPTSLDRSCFVEVLASVFEVVCSGPLQERVEQFMHEHCDDFKSEAISTSDSSPPEYKHEHYVLFKKYCDDIEDLLVSRVQEQHPNFNLAQFVEECRDVLKGHVDGNNNDNCGYCDMQAEEVFDFLLSLVDFEAFRNDMISTAMHGQDLQLRGSALTAAAAGMYRSRMCNVLGRSPAVAATEE
ncbi:hypothetical protein FOZ61_010000 [Perkinsus olseni]|uniref:BART domain-containing protein n=1 Tax=Perkinsus olseni TaxID=32597 RepID=A0A7J6KZH2_PEROL|nr:hypothetical protein FOZ61_010000 [Perkinsus olseni]